MLSISACSLVDKSFRPACDSCMPLFAAGMPLDCSTLCKVSFGVRREEYVIVTAVTPIASRPSTSQTPLRERGESVFRMFVLYAIQPSMTSISRGARGQHTEEANIPAFLSFSEQVRLDRLVCLHLNGSKKSISERPHITSMPFSQVVTKSGGTAVSGPSAAFRTAAGRLSTKRANCFTCTVSPAERWTV